MLRKFRKVELFVSLIAVSLFLTMAVVGQSNQQVRTLVNGQKYKIKGVIIARSKDTLLIRDVTGVDTKVVLTSGTSIRANAFWGSGDRYPETSLVRGLNLQASGRGDSNGSLAAQKIRFNKSDLRVAQSIDSRVTPTEDRVTKNEQNAERLSGQIDELMAISNAAKGGAKAAQETADAAVEGVNATNKRISSIDDYVVQSKSTVYFRVGSSKLSPEAKADLDNAVATAMTLRGYILEVTGYASSDGNAKANKILSQKRAQAVIEYLVDTHNVPLRRIGTSYGYGENQAVADNSTREGRAQNRRVEVKILVSRGINQNVEVRKGDGNR